MLGFPLSDEQLLRETLDFVTGDDRLRASGQPPLMLGMTSAIAEKLPVVKIGSHVSPNYKPQQAAATMLLSGKSRLML